MFWQRSDVESLGVFSNVTQDVRRSFKAIWSISKNFRIRMSFFKPTSFQTKHLKYLQLGIEVEAWLEIRVCTKYFGGVKISYHVLSLKSLAFDLISLIDFRLFRICFDPFFAISSSRDCNSLFCFAKNVRSHLSCYPIVHIVHHCYQHLIVR